MMDLAGTCANCSQELAAADSLCIDLPTEVGMRNIASKPPSAGLLERQWRRKAEPRGQNPVAAFLDSYGHEMGRGSVPSSKCVFFLSPRPLRLNA
jgi:hypothetical protein